MVLSIGNQVTLRSEKIVSAIAFGNNAVEIIMNPVSICFEFNDESGQTQFLELIKIAMSAQDATQEAKIIADGLKGIAYKNFTSYSNRNIDSRLRDIATDIATSK